MIQLNNKDKKILKRAILTLDFLKSLKKVKYINRVDKSDINKLNDYSMELISEVLDIEFLSNNKLINQLKKELI